MLSYSSLIALAHYQRFEHRCIERLFRHYREAGRNTVLDFGCGQGRYLKVFQELELSATGVDINPCQVKLLKNQGMHALTPQELANQPDMKFDVIFISHVIEHLDHQLLFDTIQNLAQRLAHDGRLVIIAPVLGDRFYYDFTHIRPYYPQSIWHVFGDNEQALSLSRSLHLKLLDIHFFRDCPRTRFWHSYYINDKPVYFHLTRAINWLIALIYLLTGARFGPVASWLGVYSCA